jgi:hypothetical protein
MRSRPSGSGLPHNSTSWRRGGRPLIIIATACAASMVASPAAQAQSVERSHEHVTDTFDVQLCGLDLVSTVDLIANEQERIGSSGFPLFQLTASGTQTFTNPDNGKSITNQFAGLASKDLSVTDNGDGTITLRTATTGVPERLRLPDGTILTMDVGRFVVVSLLDYNGTPTNADDDTLLSQSLAFEAGPHPDLDSNFDLFCQTLVANLT